MNDTRQSGEKILDISDLNAWYGESHVLHGVNFHVRRGEVVTLLGRNGAGKSTILKSIMGLVKSRSGSILHSGVETIRKRPDDIAKLGIGFCPEERAVFGSLNVHENLLLPPVIGAEGMSMDEIYEMFPNLNARRTSSGTKLSGGEQQMLAIGRILRAGAPLLLLDEPTEGLAPVIVKQIASVIHSIKARGYTILLVEQNFRFASKIADRHYMIEHGRVAIEVGREELPARRETLLAYLGV